MEAQIKQLREEITLLSAKPDFIHHEWFITHHLEIVERISLELCEKYLEADRDLVLLLVWMHDYGKLVDFANQHSATLEAGAAFLQTLGFDEEITKKTIEYIEILDAKGNLQSAPIEVQIVSSADGASHLVGPFFKAYWQEKAEYSFEQLVQENKKKMEKDWNKKVVLPEVQQAFAEHHRHAQLFNHVIPEKFLE